MSGVYLFTALYFISKYKRSEVQINIKAMTLHAAWFAVYMATILLLISARSALNNKKISDNTYDIFYGIVYLC